MIGAASFGFFLRPPFRLLSVLSVFACGAFLVACEPPPISELAAEQGIQRIRERHADSSWDKVVSDVNEFRSRYPYTQFAAEAELLQADAYFQSSRYPEAIVAYEDFLRKSPSHGNADLAFFRIGRSYDLQSPEEIDREQANAIKAIEKYGTFLERFGNSSIVPEAKERIAVLRRRVADHSAFIARFYWKKDLWQGALTRYLELIRDYGAFADLREEAVKRAAICYEKLADELERDPKSDMSLYFKGQTPADLRKKAKDIASAAAAPATPNPTDAKEGSTTAR